MANTYITSTSRFKPYTFAEMLAPIAAYQEAYDAYDAQLNTLAEDAATKAFNFAAQDTAEKAQYDALMNRLKTSADSLLTNGLNADIMREIRSINKDYRTSMIPLHQKIAKRAELAEAQRTALQNNSNLRFTIDYSKSNLKDIHAGSTYGIINLKDIEDKAALDFATVTSAMPIEDYTPIGNTGYYNIKTGYGYSPEEFDNAFKPNPTTGKIDTNNPIYQFYTQKVAEIDGRTDISDSLKLEMKEAIKRGMRAGSGEINSKVYKMATSTSDKNTKGGRKLGLTIQSWDVANNIATVVDANGVPYEFEVGEWEEDKDGVLRPKTTSLRNGVSLKDKAKNTNEQSNIKYTIKEVKDSDGNVIKFEVVAQGSTPGNIGDEVGLDGFPIGNVTPGNNAGGTGLDNVFRR